MSKTIVIAFLFGVFPIVSLFAQEPELNASVDRSVVNENESFAYTLYVQGQVSVEPDLSSLASEFEILQRSRNSSIQMINGTMSQLTEWRIQLMPRSVGSFTIPPVQLAGSLSNSVQVQVLPAVTGDTPGEIFIEVEVTPSIAYVQSQSIYMLRLFRAVNTGRSSLTAPEAIGGEAIIVPLGEDREFRARRDDKDFVVLERRYAIFPQAAGELMIEPVTFEGVVITASGLSNIQRVSSGALVLSVQPAVPPPPEYPNASWVPARALNLSERWSDEPGEFTLGVPQTRTLTIEAEGLLDTQLPELTLLQTQGVRQYADQPELDRETSPEGVQASRTERFAVIAQSPGEAIIPAVELPWFNVVGGVWEVARVDPIVSMVLGGQNEIVSPVIGLSGEAAKLEVVSGNERLWQGVSAALLGAWLLTLMVFRFGWVRRKPFINETSAVALPKPNQSQLLRGVRSACEKNDPATTRDFLLEWSEKFVVGSPKTLGCLATEVPKNLSKAVSDLERTLYGRSASSWDGLALATALKQFSQLPKTSNKATEEVLQPLYR